MKVVRRGLTSERAEQLKRRLGEREVELYTTPDDAAPGEWMLLSEPEEAGRALRFLELEEDDEEESLDPEQMLDDRTWRQWPTCPACDWPRMTRCQFCGTTGHDFPVADGAPVTEEAAVLLMCETCDEPFEPKFLQHCDRCREPFEDGVEFPYTDPIDVGNPRAWILGVGLIVVAAIVFGYWWWVLQ